MGNRTSGLLPDGNVMEKQEKFPDASELSWWRTTKERKPIGKLAFASSKLKRRVFSHLICFSSLYIPEPGPDFPKPSMRIFPMCLCHFAQRCRTQVRKAVTLF